MPVEMPLGLSGTHCQLNESEVAEWGPYWPLMGQSGAFKFSFTLHEQKLKAVFNIFVEGEETISSGQPYRIISSCNIGVVLG